MSRNLAQPITAWIPFGLPLVTIVIALPLVLEKIPPNLWYGFRTRRTLSDPDIWYRANYIGGVDLLYGGIAALVINLAISVLSWSPGTILIQIAVVVVATTIPLVVWALQMRDL